MFPDGSVTATEVPAAPLALHVIAPTTAAAPLEVTAAPCSVSAAVPSDLSRLDTAICSDVRVTLVLFVELLLVAALRRPPEATGDSFATNVTTTGRLAVRLNGHGPGITQACEVEGGERWRLRIQHRHAVTERIDSGHLV